MLSDLEREVVDSITLDEVVSLTARLVQTPSYAGDEWRLAGVLREELAAAGLEACLQDVVPGRPNLVATLGNEGAGKPKLVFCGHMDSVPPGDASTWTVDPFAGEVRDGKLYGRGASDDKGGLAGMAVAMCALKRAGVRLDGSLVLAAVCGEVQGNIGARALVAQGLTADFAVVAEYSFADRVATCYRGALWGEITLQGRSAHTGRPHQGLDTIRVAAEAVIPMLLRAGEEAPAHPLLPKPILGINMIRGGTAPNMIADRCELVVDARFPPSQKVSDVEAHIQAVLKECETRYPGLRATFRRLHAVEGFEIPGDHPTVLLLRSAIGDVTGLSEVSIMGKAGFSDANVFVAEAGIPAVAYGPGNSSGVGPDEWVDVEALVTAAKVYALFALRFLTPHTVQG